MANEPTKMIQLSLTLEEALLLSDAFALGMCVVVGQHIPGQLFHHTRSVIDHIGLEGYEEIRGRIEKLMDTTWPELQKTTHSVPVVP